MAEGCPESILISGQPSDHYSWKVDPISADSDTDWPMAAPSSENFLYAVCAVDHVGCLFLLVVGC